MKINDAAQIYVDLIHLEESLAPDQHQAKQEVSALRSKYHDLFTQALRNEGIVCADRFEATSRALELVGLYNFFEVAKDLSTQLTPISQGLHRVLKTINAAVTNRDTESLRSHLAPLRVANTFSSHVRAIEFESRCSYSNCSRPHDVILHPKQAELAEVVIEVAWINEKKLDGDVIEEQHTERVDINNPQKVSLEPFGEVRLLRTNTSVLKEAIDLLVRKSKQFCPSQQNVIWVVSQNFLFNEIEFENAVLELCREDQLFSVLGVGWLHEPTITSAHPHFFPMGNDKAMAHFMKQCDVLVKELSAVKHQE